MRREKRCLAILLLLAMIVSHGVSVQAAAPQLASGIEYDELGTKIEEFVSGSISQGDFSPISSMTHL